MQYTLNAISNNNHKSYLRRIFSDMQNNQKKIVIQNALYTNSNFVIIHDTNTNTEKDTLNYMLIWAKYQSCMLIDLNFLIYIFGFSKISTNECILLF